MPPVAAAVMAVGAGIGGAVAGTAAAVGGVAAGVGSTAAGIAGTVGATAAAVPAIVGKAGTAVTGLGKAIPATVGGVSGIAKAVEPAAKLFGAGVGIYSSVKQVQAQEKALDVAAQQAENQKKALELAAQQDASFPYVVTPAQPTQPMKTYVEVMSPAGQAEIPTPKQPQLQEQIMTYAPLILIGVVGIVLMRKIWK